MSLKKDFAIVVAIDRKTNGIGNAGDLIWRIPPDLQHFKSLTTGHIVIMGRKTFASLKQPLSNRFNIVISNNPAFISGHSNVLVVSSFEKALEKADEMTGKVFVIGGEQIYRLALQHAQCSIVHLTSIELQQEQLQQYDAFFPEIPADYIQTDCSLLMKYQQYSFCFQTYLRK